MYRRYIGDTLGVCWDNGQQKWKLLCRCFADLPEKVILQKRVLAAKKTLTAT